MMRKTLVALAALIVVGGAEAETVKARYVRLTVTASRPAPSQPPFYGGRSWQICDWTLLPSGTLSVIKAGHYVSRGTNTQIRSGRVQR